MIGAGSVGCFSGDVNVDAAIACDDAGQCPAPLRCVVAANRCAAAGDGVGPVPVDVSLTPVARNGTTVSLRFRADQALLVPPLIEAAGLAFVAGAADDAFAFSAVVDVEDGVIDDIAVAVTLVGIDGDVARTVVGVVGVDAAPPRLVVSAFVPAALSRFDRASTLALTTSEPVAEPVITIDGVRLVAANDDDAPSTSWTFTVADVELLPEGVHTVERVDLVDVVGNAGVAFFAAGGAPALVVDRTAPTVALTLAATRLGPVPPHDVSDIVVDVDSVAVLGPEVEVRAEVEVDVFIDDVAVVCADTTCVVEAGALPEGVHTVVARAGDAVGNVGAAFASFIVDATPPAISPSTEVTLRSPPGVPVAAPTTALVGSTVRVNLVATEAVADPTRLRARFALTGSSSEVLLTREADSGEFVGVVGVGIDVGVYDLVVDGLNDDVGNVGSDALAGALEVVGAVPTPCDVSFCADFDGDGVDGFSASCPAGLDCVDTNPHVWPGAPEIPGDGFGNACGTDDDVVDEAAGVFVSVDGDDGNDGSRAAPLRTITAGVARAKELLLSHVFLGGGSFGPEDNPSGCSTAAGTCTPCLSPSLHGGFDATWRRDPSVVTEVHVAAPAAGGHSDALRMQATNLQLTGLSFVVDGNFGNAVHLCAGDRVAVDDVRVVAATTAVASTTQGASPGMLLIEGTSIARGVRAVAPLNAVGVRFVGDLRLVDSRATGNVVVASLSSTGTLFVARSVLLGRLLDKPLTRTTIVSTYIQGVGTGALSVDANVGVFASTLRVVSTSTVSAGVRLEGTDAALSRPRLRIVDSILSSPSGRGFQLGAGVVDGLDAVAVTVDAPFVYFRDGVVLDATTLNQCDEVDTDPGCGDFVDAVAQRAVPFAAVSLDADGLLPPDAGRLDGDEGALIGLPLSALVLSGAPTTVISDVRGACRPEAGNTRGAFEMSEP